MDKGVWQGDPIAGLLFVLAIEFLANLIRLKLPGITIQQLRKIFQNWSPCLQVFTNAPVSVPTLTNRFYYPSSSDWSLLPIPTTASTKYLVFTISANGASITWDTVLNKSIKSLARKKLPLGISARANFFKSYTLSMFRYYVLICLPDIATSNRLDNKMYWFLFDKAHVYEPSKSYHRPVPRKKLTLPKLEGGFNIPTLSHLANMATTCWIPWSWSSTALWSKLIEQHILAAQHKLNITANILTGRKNHANSVSSQITQFIIKCWRNLHPDGCWPLNGSSISVLNTTSENVLHQAVTIQHGPSTSTVRSINTLANRTLICNNTYIQLSHYYLRSFLTCPTLPTTH